ncbi:MAG TPA: glycoside hydrolase domain-containing protein [Rhodopila sp.]|nr:glycoside hydrolase domain-containing protein [Rhodopila sp.]
MSGTIPRGKLDNPGLDYQALRTEGIALVQQMSGQIWTDYNYSDPGVTILEQLCYALTELSYRAEFPVEDLLCSPQTGRVAPMEQGLYPARAIMPVNPVTSADLRRLIVDRVRHVGNAWFTPVQVDGVDGLYRIDVLMPELDPDCCDETGPNPDAVLRRVLDCYAAHRSLCEDVHAAQVLMPLMTWIAAEVQIADHADADAVLADLLFRLGLQLSPEPERTSLQALTAAGLTTSQIFTGPLMLRGFIADDQLADLPRVICVDDLLEQMAETTGVLSVTDLRARLLPDPIWYSEGQTIPLPDGTIARLAPDRHEIRLMRGDTVCRTHAPRVRRLLERHWAAQRQTYSLWPAYATEYRAPIGQTLDLAAYNSVQDQFPAVYGIGPVGPPSGADAARDAAARQLKGYLMPFDQLMADYFSQLAFVRTLFSPLAGGDRTYAFQSLRGIVPNGAPLLQPDYDVGLASLIADTDPVTVRQADILGLLLSLYAETLLPSQPVDPAELVRAQRRLLTRVVPATRDRGRGFDYRRGSLRRGVAGMEIRARIELALLDGERHRHHHGSHVHRNGSDQGFAVLLDHALHETISRGFMPVDFTSFEDTTDDAASLSDQGVHAALLAGLADAERYRMGKLPAHEGVALVCQDSEGGWWLIGHFPGPGAATAAAHRLWWSAGGERLRLTIVEWTLLRYAGPLLGCDGSVFNFRISAVMATGWQREGESAWQRQARAILRENTPAHVVLDTVFLRRRPMRTFDRLHREWLVALRHGSAERKAETSHALATFLGLPVAARDAAAPLGSGSAVTEPAPPPTVPFSAEPPSSLSPEPPPPPSSEPSSIAPSIPPLPAVPASLPSHPEAPPNDAEREAHLTAFRERLRARRDRTEPAARSPSGAAPSSHPASPPVAARTPSRRRWWPFRARATDAPPAAPPAEPAETEQEPNGGPLVLTVQAAPSGVRGFDTATPLTFAAAQAFARQGFGFAIRYLSRTTPVTTADLSIGETDGILRAGLALMAVQPCQPEGWIPSDSLGTAFGSAAAANAAAAGLPRGLNLWLELQGVASGTAASIVAGYCNAWYDSVAAAGYLPGLYVGVGQVLTGDQLYHDLKFQYYWKPDSQYVPDIAVRGHCLEQTIDSAFEPDGIKYDADITLADSGGNTPLWVVSKGAV